MSGLPGLGSASVFIKPNFLRSPMKPFVAYWLNANEYPQRYHWKVMMEQDAMQAQIMLSADFLRASPEYRKPSPGTMINTMADATMMYA